jgi:tetratricopeptide (TPR) repeat protein
MLTRGGRVMLLDFGLSSTEAAADRRTKTGQRVGTLAYMPPEQLRGERELDARADVFALGVTLYELLALKLPHEGSSEAERLARSGLAVPADLRKLDPRISWELETVVQTATDPDPARRYSSAGALARDLDNVLENRPIEARRSGPLLRARRWIQRHPAAALAVMVVLVGPSVFALQETRANAALSAKSSELEDSNRALSEALEEATLQREAAQRNFERSYEAVELMLGRVGGEVLEGVPRMEPIRRELLRDALRLHEELLADPASDHAQGQFYARTLRRAAALHAELGQLQEALQALDQEADVLDALLAESAPWELQLSRGLVDHRRGEVSRLLGERAAAVSWGHAAVERLGRLVETDPGDETLWALARARLELAEVLALEGRDDEARAELSGATTLLHDLTDGGGGTWEQRQSLAQALHQTAGYPASHIVGQASSYDPVAGEEQLREALELRRRLVEEQPDNPTGLLGLAETAIAHGGSLAALREFEESGSAYREALAAYERLANEFPARPVYTDGIATAHLDLSLIAAALGRSGERRSHLEQAVAGFEALVDATPTPTYRRGLVLALGQLGHALSGGDAERADALLSRSLELGTPLLAEQPGDADLRTALAWSGGNLAGGRLRRGDAPGTAAAARIYVGLDLRPVEVVWAAYFLASAVAIGRAGDVEAETLGAWTDEALTLIERAAELAPADREVQKELLDPGFAAIADEARYRAVLEALDLER